jgi:hypothetical protein
LIFEQGEAILGIRLSLTLVKKVLFQLPMRFLISSLVVVLGVAAASAQEAEPSPTAAPQTTPAPQEQSGPTPTPAPQEPPQLLPESKTLPTPTTEPTLPRDLLPEGNKPQIPGSVPNPASAEQLEKDRIRFRQLRTIAVRDSYAIYLWRQAKLQHTEELKREYLRVYYINMCDEMRKLEPRLKPTIDAFEAANVGRLSPVTQRPAIPERDLPRFDASQKARD